MSTAPDTLPASPAPLDLARDMRSAGALCREGDWRRVWSLFAEHHWPGLAALGKAAGDSILGLPPHEVGPAAVLSLADPRERELVAEMLAAFGCL